MLCSLRSRVSIKDAHERSEAALAEKATAEEEIQVIEQQGKEIDPKLTALLEQLAADRENVVSMEAKCDGLRARCFDLEEELELAVSHVRTSEAELRSTCEAIDIIQADCSSASDDLCRVEGELRQQEKAIVGSREDAQSAQRRLSELRNAKERQVLDIKQSKLLWFSDKGKRKPPWMRWNESRMN